MTTTTKPEMHVAFCVTESYVDFCAITLASLCDNNPESAITAHLLTEDVTPASEQRLQALCDRWGATVCVHDVTELIKPFAAVYRNVKFHISASYRLYMADVLPHTLERVLYVDCDMIVRRSLRELYDTPFEGNALLASRDSPKYEAGRPPRKIQHSLSENYFNSGMMVVNLAYWREANIATRCLDLYKVSPDDYPYPDQDLLNDLLRGYIKYVDYSYNCQTYFFRRMYYRKPNAPKPNKTLLLDPHIVHFMCKRKAWAPRVIHTYHDDFFKYSQLACGRRMMRMPWLKYWCLRSTYVLPVYLGLTRGRFMSREDIMKLPD